VDGLAKPMPIPLSDNHTVFGDEVVKNIEGKQVVETEYRRGRKLVGWLVSYSVDKMGADFRLYEGRNIVGRDNDCNITVLDKMISGKHAVILFKNDKYKIKDELSSHGTFVNDRDIEDEHAELHDGDLIRMGETVFKFRSSL
jgi:pSer/pThr/pTyr-binding forkhead associated (FHA) protein